MTHTPGPWSVQKFTDEPVSVIVGSAGDERVCEMHSNELATTVTANARLIAAAPEMLAALKMMVCVANYGEIDEFTMFASIEKAKAVITKAEGRQP